MMNTQQNQKSICNDIYLEEYKALRDEILLRTREKNRTINHVILLISALIVAIWQIPGRIEPERTYIIFLLIIPIISFMLALIYCWHDLMIASIGGYIDQLLRPKLAELYGKEDILEWERYLHKCRQSFSWKTMSFLNRLILVLPIPVSTISLFVLMEPLFLSIIKITLLLFNLAIFMCILIIFLLIDRKYLKIKQ